VTYRIVNASEWSLDQLAPYMTDILHEMGRLAKRFPKDVTTAGLFQEFLAGKKTLWLVLDDDKFAAMAMTRIRTIDCTGNRVFTLCDIAGKDVSRFDDLLTETMEAAAATNNCEPEFEGREGWARFAKKHGYRPYAVLYRKSANGI
jgi:hypothetical protein